MKNEIQMAVNVFSSIIIVQLYCYRLVKIFIFYFCLDISLKFQFLAFTIHLWCHVVKIFYDFFEPID